MNSHKNSYIYTVSNYLNYEKSTFPNISYT